MKTEIKKIDNTKRELAVEVSGEIVKNKFSEAFKEIAKNAKVPGFRQGHVPQDILEKKFSQAANEMVLKELLPQVYNQALEQEKLDVTELPSITDVKLDRASLSFKATVEVMPEIKLKDYKGIRLSYRKLQVSAEEVDRSLDTLKESRKLSSLDDAAARTLGYPALPALREAVEKQLYLQKENQQRQKMESDIVEAVTKGLDFKLPDGLVQRQLEDMLRQAKVDLAMRGMPREKIEEEDPLLRKELAPRAQEQVRVYLVLAEIAKKEKIALDDHMPRQVMEFLLKEARWEETVK